jgi:hydroxymethylpyrimidine pyrophosphatase-like HAD family hydrolase
MALPSGVNKGTELLVALRELGLSVHDVVGIGDAENDHAFVRLCEVGVAVDSALPSVKEECDHVTYRSVHQRRPIRRSCGAPLSSPALSP